MNTNKKSRGLAWSHGKARMELVPHKILKIKGHTCEYCKVTFRLRATLLNHICSVKDRQYFYIKQTHLKSNDNL